jgi:hypothetical protein
MAISRQFRRQEVSVLVWRGRKHQVLNVGGAWVLDVFSRGENPIATVVALSLIF